MTTQQAPPPGSAGRDAGRDADRDAELLELAPLVRRVVAARVGDPATVDDLVQEAIARVLEARPRLEDRALAPYAVATARNLTASHYRGRDRDRRNHPRLHDPSSPERPEEAALRREEDAAVAAAVASLPERDRQVLLAHEVEGEGMAELARRTHSTPGAVAVRLARARAVVRVDWLVAYRGVELPTERCRPVLVALSSGDRRRQRELDAAGHLRTCGACADLAEPLVERRRSLAVWIPLAGLWWLGQRAWTWAKAHRVAAAVTLASLTLGGALTVPRLLDRPPPPTPPTPPPPVAAAPPARAPAPAPAAQGPAVPGVRVLDGTPGGAPLRPGVNGGSLARYAGKAVVFDRAPVRDADGDGEVNADEGFWVGSPQARVWVQFSDSGESPPTVTATSRISFTGRMVANGRGFAVRVGASGAEGGAQLDGQGDHVEVHSSRIALGR